MEVGNRDDTLARRMDDCRARAQAARQLGDRVGYQRLVEEFLFLSHASVGVRSSSVRRPLPHLVVLNLAQRPRDDLTRVLREGLIEHRFPAMVEEVRALDAFLERLEGRELHPLDVFVIINRFRRDTAVGIAKIPQHTPRDGRPLLILSLNMDGVDASLTRDGDGLVFAPFPHDLDGFGALAELLRSMLIDHGQRAQRAPGS